MRRRAIDAVNRHWSESQKIEAVQAFVMFGKVPVVAAMTGVPKGTIAQWKLQDWWKDLESEIRASDDIELSGKLKRVIDKSIDVVADRLDQGDWFYDQKSGEVRRKPVSLRDAHTVAKDMIDKKRILENKPTSITEHKIDDRLLDLKKKFEEFALNFQKPAEKVIEADYEEIDYALHEGRKEGLQEGIRLDQEDGGLEEDSRESEGQT